MAFSCRRHDDGVTVVLTGFDRAATWRRRVVLPDQAIAAASVVRRDELERLVDHRVIGFGTHLGARRPGRRRVGVMLGRGAIGAQFWAVPAGPPDRRLLVIDLDDHEFVRAVLAVDDPDRWASQLDTSYPP